MDVPIEYGRFPLLASLAWNRATPTLSAHEALYLYESARGRVVPDELSPEERALFDRLVREFGGGVFLG